MKQVDKRYLWFYKFYNILARFEIKKLLSVRCTGCQVAHRTGMQDVVLRFTEVPVALRSTH